MLMAQHRVRHSRAAAVVLAKVDGCVVGGRHPDGSAHVDQSGATPELD